MDKILIEILEDGTIKMTTDPISGANHASADQFLREIGRLAGTEQIIERRQGARHHHAHAHDHVKA